MAKKRAKAKKKPTGTRKQAATAAKPPRRGDRSRLDLTPLHDHISERIDYLKKHRQLPGGAAPAAAGVAAFGEESVDDTIERLQNALDTIADICHPTMDIPI